jgi:hypothetical protein
MRASRRSVRVSAWVVLAVGFVAACGGRAQAAPTDNLVAHWKLDETTGLTAFDSSGQGNDGTLSGGPVWQPAGGVTDGALQFDGGTGVVYMEGVEAANTTGIAQTVNNSA